MATLANAYRSLLADTLAAVLDGGDIRFETSGNAEVATCAFGDPAFGSATNGVATANAITPDSDAEGGTIDHALLRTDDPATVLTCTCSTTSGDFVLSSLEIGAGDTLSISSLTLTMPAS
jgi:hypothetical protein